MLRGLRDALEGEVVDGVGVKMGWGEVGKSSRDLSSQQRRPMLDVVRASGGVFMYGT